MNNYEQQANEFLADCRVTFKIEKAVPQTCPAQSRCESYIYRIGTKGVRVPHNHGIKYNASFTKGGKILNIPFWSSLHDTYDKAAKTVINDHMKHNVVNDPKDVTKPTAYDVLACVSGDVHAHNMTFDDFCSMFDYSNDSISAKQSYESVCDLSRNLSRFFTSEELEKLQEIQ